MNGAGVIRRHPVRWTLATGGLATLMALAGGSVAGATSSGSAGGMASGAHPPSKAGAPVGNAAMVSSITGSTIVLKKPGNATETVTTTSATVYQKGTTTVTASDLKVGELVTVTTTTSAGTETATKITILGAPPGGKGGKGPGPRGTRPATGGAMPAA